MVRTLQNLLPDMWEGCAWHLIICSWYFLTSRWIGFPQLMYPKPFIVSFLYFFCYFMSKWISASSVEYIIDKICLRADLWNIVTDILFYMLRIQTWIGPISLEIVHVWQSVNISALNPPQKVTCWNCPCCLNSDMDFPIKSMGRGLWADFTYTQ